MAKIFGRLIGLIINIISIPFILVFLILNIPFSYFKAKKRIRASNLFSHHEKSLLEQSQRAISMVENGLLNPNRDILVVAELIEESRIEYQLMKNHQQTEITFIEFLMPRVTVLQVKISDWESVSNYFEFK